MDAIKVNEFMLITDKIAKSMLSSPLHLTRGKAAASINSYRKEIAKKTINHLTPGADYFEKNALTWIELFHYSTLSKVDANIYETRAPFEIDDEFQKLLSWSFKENNGFSFSSFFFQKELYCYLSVKVNNVETESSIKIENLSPLTGFKIEVLLTIKKETEELLNSKKKNHIDLYLSFKQNCLNLANKKFELVEILKKTRQFLSCEEDVIEALGRFVFMSWLYDITKNDLNNKGGYIYGIFPHSCIGGLNYRTGTLLALNLDTLDENDLFQHGSKLNKWASHLHYFESLYYIIRQQKKSAKAAIMSRNLSHNVGSHVFANSSFFDSVGVLNVATDSDMDNVDFGKIRRARHRLGQFNNYIQGRMDFMARVIEV